MSDCMLKQLPCDLSHQAGLAWVGKYLKRININSLIDPAFSVRSGIANSDILKSYLGLLCLGKNDFDAIEGQRMDTHAAAWCELADQHTLHEPHSPVRHTAQRRRIRTVMQELMFKAARMVYHARQWVLGLGANDAAFAVQWVATQYAALRQQAPP